jgi:PAS domain-containing protein
VRFLDEGMRVMAGRSDRCADDAELRSLLASIVESSTDAVIALTLDGLVTSWNGGAEAMYGYTAAEMTGRHKSVVYPPDRTGELTPILDEATIALISASLILGRARPRVPPGPACVQRA